MNMTRLFAATVALVGATGFAAMADITRPECIAPANPGGGFDLTCRVVQIGLADQMPEPVQVTFMPGGIGAVAINLFNTTRTDDSNAIVAFSSGSLLNIATGKFGEWTENDVRWLASAGTDYGAVVVREDSPFETLDDVMAAAKEDLSGIVFGAGGSVGSQDWMKAAILLKSEGLDPKAMRYVAFDGGGASIAALLGGSIDVYTGDVAEQAAHIGAGTMRVLAVMAPERLDAPYDQFPTARELGYDAVWSIVRGFYMGKDVSDEDYDAWVAAFNAAYETEGFAQNQADKGLLPYNLAGPEFAAEMKAGVEDMRTIAREAGLLE
ncbi:MAG: TTT-type tricarboxlyic acid uptake system substrate-binding component TctC [Roseibaca calidilacus]|uniref:TTT-type tricarboxlyic acid uptake system substrate-binding component TctC n=2 Tax=Roseibaca calidilacus TaxID=1666912 RepID=A0A0P7VRD7_9RHOB|nr:MAG: TTT-type tricarboxlyic acid uptake system substrate-binding component TctC [Roseibaca calidilacus]CUX83048.1 putative tricarboxylic transport membrane protein [Roseibaca calidilacus]